MDINLSQKDIDNAITSYMAAQGMRAPVSAITYTQSRRGGNSLSATVTLQGGLTALAGVSAAPVAAQSTPADAVEAVAENVVAAPVEPVVEPVAEVVEEVAEEAVVEAVEEAAEDTPPFETEAAPVEAVVAAEAQAAVTKPTSLFGG